MSAPQAAHHGEEDAKGSSDSQAGMDALADSGQGGVASDDYDQFVFDYGGDGVDEAISSGVDAGDGAAVDGEAGLVARGPSGASLGSMEEVEVLGKAANGIEAKLLVEVFEADVHIDALSSLEISRNGDSNAAAALVRLPGLSLVDEKYVYVRGLGERYSSNTLNQGLVPSPDLTRDVLPLDIFPTSIIESVTVRKSYDVDRPASFGGGEIDLRTLSIPREFFVEAELDIGANSDVDGYKSYPSHTLALGSLPDADALLADELSVALGRFGGNISKNSISQVIRESYDTAAESTEAAAGINRELATHLNRDFAINDETPGPDYGLSLSGGDLYYLQDNESTLGYIGHISYDVSQRHRNIEHRSLSDADVNYSMVDESNEDINIVGYGSVGMELPWNQTVSVKYVFLRNTTDKTYIEDIHHQTLVDDSLDNRMDRQYWLRFQSRELSTWQISGKHGPDDLVNINWQVSLSRVNNEIPSELNLDSGVILDDQGAIRSESISKGVDNISLAYTSLSGSTNSYALSAMIPLGAELRHTLEFGFDLSHESRDLHQSQLRFGSSRLSVPIVNGNLLGVFTNDYIMDPGNDVEIRFLGDAAEPYSASASTLGFFSLYRVSLGPSWRVGAGLRWESYDHNISLLDAITLQPRSHGGGRFEDGSFFPSLNVVYTSEGNGWSDSFQARLSYGRTVVRPDAREISRATFIHPVTSNRISGNPSVIPSMIDNVNLAVSWTFESKESLSAALFYKLISDPIESFEVAASDTDLASLKALTVLNAESASVFGIELGGRVNIWREQLFLTGNLSLLNTSLTAGDELSLTPTNPTRSLTNASDYVANLAFGYEHPEGDHHLRVVYTWFGERLQYAGFSGNPDAIEAPSQWLNINYLYSFGAGFGVQAKLSNLLDEDIEISRGGQTVYRANIGLEYALSLSWRY